MAQDDMITKLKDDIADQPAALARLFDAYRQGHNAKALATAAELVRGSGYPVMLLGMGGSYAACVAAAQALAMAGTSALAVDAAEFLHYQAASLPAGVPLVLVSYSGVSAEPIEIERALHGCHPLILITDKPETPLARAVDHVLPLHCGPELAVATKSFTSTLALLLMLGTAIRDEDGVAELADVAARSAALLAEHDMGSTILAFFGGVPDYLNVVGRGPGYGTALHAGLILREFLALRSGWMTAGGFRHGPLLDIGEGDRVIVIAGGRTAHLGRRLAEDVASRGGRALHVTTERAAERDGILQVVIETGNEAIFALLASLPLENLLVAAADVAGSRYVRIQTEVE
jgi:glucosamine--fructose-6-phosphate aminotransferase (isomerizing)